MTPERNEEERITLALEQAPAVAVPADFAVRVMERPPERKVARVDAGHGLWPSRTSRRRTHYGRNAMLAGTVLLCCLLVAGALASKGGCGVAAGGMDRAGAALRDRAVVRAGVADAVFCVGICHPGGGACGARGGARFLWSLTLGFVGDLAFSHVPKQGHGAPRFLRLPTQGHSAFRTIVITLCNLSAA